MAEKRVTTDEARRIGEEIGIDWSVSPFDVEQPRMGMDVELEALSNGVGVEAMTERAQGAQ